MSKPDLDEITFEATFNQNFVIELTDGSLYELIPDGANIKVNYSDRFKFIQLALKARLSEAENQIEMLKNGICKLIPQSLLRCNNFIYYK